MMDVPDILPQLEKLDDEIDHLEDVLKPLLSLGELASQLPLLDKAKLYVLATYSIESMLFCITSLTILLGSNLIIITAALRLSGVDAKHHPVFQELTRVRQYFLKIKNLENPPEPRENSVNKEAAIRFLKADLVGSTVWWDSPLLMCSRPTTRRW